jgi:hypothetical protein
VSSRCCLNNKTWSVNWTRAKLLSVLISNLLSVIYSYETDKIYSFSKDG